MLKVLVSRVSPAVVSANSFARAHARSCAFLLAFAVVFALSASPVMAQSASETVTIPDLPAGANAQAAILAIYGKLLPIIFPILGLLIIVSVLIRYIWKSKRSV